MIKGFKKYKKNIYIHLWKLLNGTIFGREEYQEQKRVSQGGGSGLGLIQHKP